MPTTPPEPQHLFRSVTPLCLGVAAALAVLACLLSPVRAAAAPSVTFGAQFLPLSHLGEGGVVGTELTFSGSEYHGQVAPLTSLKLHLPAETVLSNAGFPTCSQETVLFDIWWEDCPEGSLAGPTGSFIAVAYNGSQAVSESGAVYPFFGPGERLYLLLVGSPPLGLEFID